MGLSQTLTVTETSYSVTNNTSLVRIKWTSTQSGDSWNGYTRTAYYYYSVNGGSETTKTVSYTLPKNSTVTIVDTTLTVAHKPDGSGTVKVRTWMDTDISYGVVEDSKTLTLTTIPRASTLSVSDSNRTLGVQQTLSADRKSSSFTHTLTWKCGTHEGTIATKSSATSWTFTPGEELSDGAPYGSKVYCSFKLTTYKGTTAVGSDSKAAWYTIPSTVKPSCSLSLSDNKGYKPTYGGYIQGESKLSVTINATQAYGSPISRYSASANGTTYSSKEFTTGVLKTAGESVPIRATVTDGRGRSGSASTTIKVIPYKRPRITNLTVHRCNSDGTANDLGAYCKVSFECTITSLSNKNTKSCVLKYRQSGATEWTMAPAITLSSYTANCSPPVIAMSEEHSYEVMVSATDAFGTTIATTSVSTGYCLYHIPASGKGITFGGIAEGDDFHVKMSATFGENVNLKKNLQLNGNLTGKYLTGTWLQTTAVTDLSKAPPKIAVLDNAGWIYYRTLDELRNDLGLADFVVAQGDSSSGSGTWTYRKWNSGLAECWTRWTIAKPYSLPGICSYVLYLPLTFASTEYKVLAQPSKNGKQLDWYGPFNSVGAPEKQAAQMAFSMYYKNTTAFPIIFDIQVVGRWK